MSRSRTTRLGVWLAVGIALAGLLVACAEKNADATRYHCPMHPTYVSDEPGDCPICGMRLVPIKEAAHVAAVEPSDHGYGASSAAGVTAAAGSAGERKLLYYRSPMDPKVTSPAPAKDSMGMDFVPVYSDEVPAPGAAPSPAGLAAVSVGDEGMRLAGVQTAAAVRDRLQRTVRTVGTVTADETRIRHVHTKIAGWVDKLYVDFTGQVVVKGQPLLAIYSPELLASQEEYLRAREAAGRFAQSSLPEVKKGGEELVTAARRRLELWDVSPAFLTTLARTGKPQRAVPVLAITLLLIFALLYFNTRSGIKAMIVLLAVPFSAVGAIVLFHLLGYNVSIAAWVGMIALLGLDAETGVFMLLFLDLSWEEARDAGKLRHRADLDEAIMHGAVKRARPKMMTVMAAFMGLLPIMWSTSAGADVMKRIAAPMIGGLVTSFLLELLVYPAVYKLWRGRGLPPAPKPEPEPVEDSIPDLPVGVANAPADAEVPA